MGQLTCLREFASPSTVTIEAVSAPNNASNVTLDASGVR
ncbi:MAG: hypothetical protein QOG34_383 [Frankiaceae bacterium]|jgi:hypothetical protein|nr:hypothetical protein [Frankiaceae bacterium]